MVQLVVAVTTLTAGRLQRGNKASMIGAPPMPQAYDAASGAPSLGKSRVSSPESRVPSPESTPRLAVMPGLPLWCCPGDSPSRFHGQDRWAPQLAAPELRWWFRRVIRLAVVVPVTAQFSYIAMYLQKASTRQRFRVKQTPHRLMIVSGSAHPSRRAELSGHPPSRACYVAIAHSAQCTHGSHRNGPRANCPRQTMLADCWSSATAPLARCMHPAIAPSRAIAQLPLSTVVGRDWSLWLLEAHQNGGPVADL
ncbi:uncharacterized protein UV8b_01218 [Ustilaginoidea virens]|uniref:Uncharacterized protein n=1 Tax=Ustilaginoidea virens TaxID=1159556 RepID=A0A8E5HKJ0_USTVR|nr:uncharacterized protein UV8b_01218 [Ustilaginoidea virens]QUC16977.1 hypothetical protein UV8b_01218 [Ustilaginoidea virens]